MGSVLDQVKEANNQDVSNVMDAVKAANENNIGANDVGYLSVQDIFLDRTRIEQNKWKVIDKDTPQESVSKALSVPRDLVDTSGADFMTRLDFSFSDDIEDIRIKFKKQYPQGEVYRLSYNPQYKSTKPGEEGPHSKKTIDTLVYRERAYDENGEILPITKDSKVKTIEGLDTGYNDIADLGGPALPMAGAILAPYLAPPGIIYAALSMGTGYALGELAKHEINIFGFDSDMSQKEALVDAAREGRDMAVLMAITGGAYKTTKWALQRGASVAMSESSPELKAVQQRAMKFVEEQKGRMPTLDADQLLQENMIAQRLGRQARSTASKAKHKSVAQQHAAAQTLDAESAGSIEVIGKKLINIAKRQYRTTKNRILDSIYGRGRTTLEQGGRSLTTGSKVWQKNEKLRMGAAWTQVDDAAAKSSPVFSLNTATVEGGSTVRQVAWDVKNFVNAEAGMLKAQGVNVAETPIGKLQGIISDIDKISSTQTNYQVLKQLRTRVGQVIEQWPWNSSVNSSQARRLYAALSDSMMNPVNLNPLTAQYSQLASKASGVSKAYYDMLDDAAIRRIIQSSTPASLAADIGKPGSLTPNVRELIDKMPAQYAKRFKESVIYNDVLLNPGGSVASLEKWELTHPEGLQFLLPSKAAKRQLYGVAQDMDTLRASNFAKAIEADAKATDAARTMLLTKGTGPSETKALAASVGEDGVNLLRKGIYHDIVDRSVSATGKYGIPNVNRDTLAAAIKEYKATGAWQHILNPADRLKINGMKAYVDLLYKGAADAGVSLEAAQAITALKSPVTFMSGARVLAVNAIMARVMESRAFTEWAISHNLDKPIVLNLAQSKTRWLGLISEALLEGMEPTQNVNPVSPALEAIYSIPTSPQPIIDYVSEFNIPQG